MVQVWVDRFSVAAGDDGQDHAQCWGFEQWPSPAQVMLRAHRENYLPTVAGPVAWRVRAGPRHPSRAERLADRWPALARWWRPVWSDRSQDQWEALSHRLWSPVPEGLAGTLALTFEYRAGDHAAGPLRPWAELSSSDPESAG